MPRPCIICSRADRPLIEGAIDAGASDYRIAREFGIERSAVCRHRLRHMARVEEDRRVVLGRDRAARRERRELAAAAKMDEAPVSVLVEALLGVRAQALKMKSIEERLERVAAKAEQDDAPQHVAAVSGQQLRAVEVGSRLAGNPNFVPRANESAGSGGQQFSITINLGEGRQVKIAATPAAQGAGAGVSVDEDGNRVIEGEVDPEDPASKIAEDPERT